METPLKVRMCFAVHFDLDTAAVADHDRPGRKKWLRPGRKYLIGRTLKEGMDGLNITSNANNDTSAHTGTAGQIIIQDPHVSRKHLTIEIANVAEGKGVSSLLPPHRFFSLSLSEAMPYITL